jgi:hypothetical protein
MNPSNQPEPKCVYCGDPVDMLLPGCSYNALLGCHYHGSCHDKQNDSPKEAVSPSAVCDDSSIPDAQAEAGLREKLANFRLGDGAPLNDAELDELMDLFHADKAAAVVEAEARGGIKSLQELWQKVGIEAEYITTVRSISDKMVLNLQARLQPPTAGESGSV